MDQVTPEQLAALGLDMSAAQRATELISSHPAGEAWRELSQNILTPTHSFRLHKLLYDSVFVDWDPTLAPPPAWTPSAESVSATNIGKLMAELNIESYAGFHSWSTQEREAFWKLIIGKLGIQFRKECSQIMDLPRGPEFPQWLPGSELNIADSCFLAPNDTTAIVYREMDDDLSRMTYGELDLATNRVANSLVKAEFTPGDAIACYMPMTVESVIIYLGIVKAGCVVVSIADSFAPDEIDKRLRLSNAKGIFTQDFILRGEKRLPLYEKVVSADGPKAIVVPSDGTASVDLREEDVWWNEFLVDDDQFTAVARDPRDHTNILFSSGTTGDPKAIPWTQTTPIKCAADGYLHHNIQPGDVVAWPTNLGWMMGPWLIYASLMNQATIALYYGIPTGKGFAKFVQDAEVTMLGVVPSLVKAWRNGNCIDGLNWSSINAFSSTGECSNADDMLFLMSQAGYKPVIEYCGGTEIGGGYATGTVVQPASPATFSTPALGLDFVLMDDEGQQTDNGEVFLVPPSIGLSTELLNRDHHEVYFEDVPEGPGRKLLRRHGDQIEQLGAGYYRAHGRADDTMNLGGIKVSSAEIERVLGVVAGVVETAAVAVPDEGGGPGKLVIYAVCGPEVAKDKESLISTMQSEIKSRLNPLFKIHDLVIADSLPRTASNKVMHRQLRADYVQRG